MENHLRKILQEDSLSELAKFWDSHELVEFESELEEVETPFVELPDRRLLMIRSLGPEEEDTLVGDLLESDPKFQSMEAKSKSGLRRPFLVTD